MNVFVLSEAQNEAFGTDYRSPEELDAKIDAISLAVQHSPSSNLKTMGKRCRSWRATARLAPVMSAS
jgi:hypothetical protein